MSATTLRCEAVRQSFGGVHALAGVDLCCAGPGIAAIIGPNGAGKTTLFNVVTGFLKADGGRCFFGEREITGLPPHRIARLGVARTFQDLRLIFQVSALDNVVLARPDQKGERAWNALLGAGVAREETANRAEALRLLRFVGLETKAGELAGELSYGQQKLLSLACCLATNAGILLLDEPFAGVHPQMADHIGDLLVELRDEGKLIVFIEHDLATVRRIADRVIVLDAGRVLAEGPPAEVLDRPEIAEAYLD